MKEETLYKVLLVDDNDDEKFVEGYQIKAEAKGIELDVATKYKVLWVEDDESITESYWFKAYTKGIELDVTTNWEEAEEKLRINFNEYTAIILDAHCKIKKDDNVASKNFLGHASVRLSRIFGEKHKFIPWYVLSAGTMDDFGVVLELINTEERKNFDSLWGPLRYIKAVDEEVLFDNIKKVSSNTSINTVLFRHAEVFKYLGEGRIFDYVNARIYMLKMLSALYYPEENLNFEYEGNPLRKVLEYIFRGANRYGLLPDDCFDTNGNIVLLDASRYMAGLEINVYDGRTVKHKVRYGESGESIFNPEITMFVRNILNFSNSDSHTNEDDPYVIEENKKEIFFGYVLQLCHVIKWLGKYIEDNPDKEVNKSKTKIILTPTNAKQESEEKTIVKPEDKPIETETTTKAKQESTEKVTVKPEDKPIEIPQKESIIETEANIMYHRCEKLACGTYCKLDSKWTSEIGKKAKIKSIVENEGKDSKDLPYIATEIEIIE